MPGGPAVARLVATTVAYNALNVPSVDVYISRFPGDPGRDGRGVANLNYEILVDGVRVRQATTRADGRIQVRLPGGMRVVLRVMGSEYEVTRLAGLHPIAEFRGVQQRLEMLGYHPGALHGDNRRADTYNNPSEKTERAILNFQTDNNLHDDAKFGPNSSTALARRMQRTGGE